MIVGAKTTARFFGVILVCMLVYEHHRHREGRKSQGGGGGRHTKFSLSRLATRARWKTRNSRQSRCLGGNMLIVFRRCVERSAESSIAVVRLASAQKVDVIKPTDRFQNTIINIKRQ